MSFKILEIIKHEIENKKVEWYKLEEIVTIKPGSRITKAMMNDNFKYPVMGGGVKATGYYNDWNFENVVTVIKYGAAGYVNWIGEKFWAMDVCFVLLPKSNSLLDRFLYYYLKSKQQDLINLKRATAFPPELERNALATFLVPVPSLELQSKIVEILDEFTSLEAELEARNKQYNYYLHDLLNFEGEKAENVEFLKLSEIAKINSGIELTKDKMKDDYPYPVMGGGYKPTGRYHDYNSESGIAIAKDGVYAGFVNWIDTNFWCTGHCYTVKTSSEKTTNKFLFYYLKSKEYEIKEQKIGSAIPSIYKDILNKILVPLPSLEEQSRIVNILDKFSKLTSDINEGLPAEIKMRRQQYEYCREKLLTFSQKYNS
ncbi:restriction endonuclease subunit S [Mycoplasmopsis agassizii]|uniref:restriction endonuclease subunit S n=1 Tax=Mycoplasmopsis agassizii TaxID=33922 RepID=UPI003527B315